MKVRRGTTVQTSFMHKKDCYVFDSGLVKIDAKQMNMC